MENKVYLKGSSKNGEALIKLLINKYGAKNPYNWDGNDDESIFYIDSDGNIRCCPLNKANADKFTGKGYSEVKMAENTISSNSNPLKKMYDYYELKKENISFEVFETMSEIDPTFENESLSNNMQWMINQFRAGKLTFEEIDEDMAYALYDLNELTSLFYSIDKLKKYRKFSNIFRYKNLRELQDTVDILYNEDDISAIIYGEDPLSSYTHITGGSEDNWGFDNDEDWGSEPSTNNWDSWQKYFDDREKEYQNRPYEKIEKKSDVLVIHPDDRSTDCLNVIYEGRGWDVLTDVDTPSDEILRCINEHDRIIMLGHGSGSGLMRPGRGGYMVDKRHADALRDKTTFSIWCFSDEYFRKYNIRGFHTGMIISEVHEASWNGIKTTQDVIDRDNALLSDCFKNCIDMEPEQIQEYMLEHYKAPEGEYDPVIEFNRKNFDIIY